MKKLEDIPKKSIFEVPEGYFDKLPGVIQSRVSEINPGRERTYFLAFSFRYALGAIVLVAASIFAYQYYNAPPTDVESILASVDSQDLVEYLDSDEVPIEEILENIDTNEINPDELRTMELDFSDEDLMDLSNEFENDQF